MSAKRPNATPVEMYEAKLAILTLDDLGLLVYSDREKWRGAADELVAGQRPHMTLERRERGDYVRRKLWHPCETRFFDPKHSPSSRPSPGRGASTV